MIESIEISNFRCFKHLKVTFKPGVNLLIGDNASGKTSLLRACKFAANAFFSGYSDVFTKWSTPGIDDFSRFIIGEKKLPTQPIDIQFTINNEGCGSMRNEMHNLPQHLIVQSEKQRRPLLSGLRDIRDYGRFLAKSNIIFLPNGEIKQEEALPLIASYSTTVTLRTPKVNASYFSEAGQSPSMGYYLCSATDGLLKYWMKRLLVLKEADYNPLEREIVTDALMRMFGPDGCGAFIDLDIRINRKEVVCIMADGRETPVSLLSDGYLRLFGIVTDIAFRCALLNSLKFGADAARCTKGVVIIDEIDLHLHPSLQARVLKALHNTFPGLQIIASTHAPMVMAGVDSDYSNCVLYMDYDSIESRYTINSVATYGMDLTTIAESVLNVPGRVPEVADTFSELSTLIDNGDFEKAKSVLETLKNRFGDRLPELAGYDTQITVEEAFASEEALTYGQD